MTSSLPLDGPARRSILERRCRVLEAFLATRRLTKEEVASEAQAIGAPGSVHFVSTIVYGLAGSTSDIDIIIVVDDAQADTARISSMAFFKESRLGVKLYTRADLDISLARLQMLAESAADHIVRAVETWSEPVPFRDVERLINSVTTAGACLWLDHLPDLCRIRFVTSVNHFRESQVYAIMAGRAGEARGSWGYLLHGLQHAMDAVLACEGSVVTNVKWTAERWQRSNARRDPRWMMLTTWWDRAWSELRGGAPAPDGAALTTLYRAIMDALALELVEDDDLFRWRDDVETAKFAPSVWLSRDKAGRMALHPTEGRHDAVSLAELATLDAEATTLLSAARAGFVSAGLRATRLTVPLALSIGVGE
jgi:hypothetical protein